LRDGWKGGLLMRLKPNMGLVQSPICHHAKPKEAGNKQPGFKVSVDLIAFHRLHLDQVANGTRKKVETAWTSLRELNENASKRSVRRAGQ